MFYLVVLYSKGDGSEGSAGVVGLFIRCGFSRGCIVFVFVDIVGFFLRL